jgi:RimJ/RimL family protein N-acetyltransferase
MRYAHIVASIGEVSLEDIEESDAEAIAAYFHRPDTHLDTLVDRGKLRSPEETRRAFAAMARTGDKEQPRTAFAIRLDGRLIGHTTLIRHTPQVNYSHWHIHDPSLRGSGVSTALYPHRIKMYFDLYPIERLIHQTKPGNVGVNRMLDRFVPIASTDWLEKPDGFAKPGLHHHRYVHREDIARFFEIAERLTKMDRRADERRGTTSR